jgi:arginine utilization protein RocB
MESLDYLAMAILAAIFIGLGFTLYYNYQRGAAEREFEATAQLLADRIKAMAQQDVGTTEYLEIFVPASCELSFFDNMVSIRIGSSSRNFPVGISVSGSVPSGQKVKLLLQRLDGGIHVSTT